MNEKLQTYFANKLLRSTKPIIWFDENRKMQVHLCQCDPYCDQPERSKREDSVPVVNIDFDKQADHLYKACSTEMRCSEHCGNTVRDK